MTGDARGHDREDPRQDRQGLPARFEPGEEQARRGRDGHALRLRHRPAQKSCVPVSEAPCSRTAAVKSAPTAQSQPRRRQVSSPPA